MGFTLQSEDDVRRLVRSVLATERQAFPATRPTQHLYSPLGESLPSIPCVNTSGLTIPAYGLVKKNGVTAGGRVQCVRPDATWGQYLVNLAGDVPAGQDFRAYGSGQVTVLLGAGGTGNSAGPIPNSFGAKAGSPLIHQWVSGGTNLLIGSLDPPQVLVGKPSSNITIGGNGSMIVHDNNRVAISPQITVSIAYAFASLTTAKFMTAIFNAGAWYGAPLEC